MAVPILHDVKIEGSLEIAGNKGSESVEFNKNEARNIRVHNLSTEPSSPVAGMIIFNTTTGKFGWFNGSVWVYPDMQKSVYDANGDNIVDSAYNSDLLDGQHGAYYLNRANGTGQVPASGLADHDSMHYDITLNSFAAPTADVSMNSRKITSLSDPISDTDAANKRYVDALIQGIKGKPSVKAATTANITLSGAQTIDGISLVAGDRCLVKNQTTTGTNGIYVVNASSWVRASDADTWNELVSAYVWIEQGAQADTGWLCTADQGGTLGTTALLWTQFSGSGDIIAGDGLSKSGTTLSLNVDGQSLEISSDIAQVKLNAAGALSKSASGLGVNVDGTSIIISGNVLTLGSANNVKRYSATKTFNGSETSWAVTHNLASNLIFARLYHVSGDSRCTANQDVMADIVRTSTNVITVSFKYAPPANAVYGIQILL